MHAKTLMLMMVLLIIGTSQVSVAKLNIHSLYHEIQYSMAWYIT